MNEWDANQTEDSGVTWADIPQEEKDAFDRGEFSHVCGELCICPRHKTPLVYHRPSDEHACQDSTCVFAHGGL